MCGAYCRSDKAEIAADLDRVMTRFPRLRERRRQVAGTMSGGERQMLAIGRGLMARPELLILDEPSLGLAPLLVEEVFNIIAGLKALKSKGNDIMAFHIMDDYELTFPFEDMAQQFGGQLRMPLPFSGALLGLVGITRSRRSAYDALMLQLHDRMKADLTYQANAPQTAVFLAGFLTAVTGFGFNAVSLPLIVVDDDAERARHLVADSLEAAA